MVALARTPSSLSVEDARRLARQLFDLDVSKVSELPIPKLLEDLLMTCLEKEPQKRPRSALELDSQLARVRCEEPWTEERARAWWSAHAPDIVAER